MFIFIFMIIPGVGFVFYLFFGRNWKKAYDNKIKLPQFLAKQLVGIFEPLRQVQDEKAGHIKGISYAEKDLITSCRNSSISGYKDPIFPPPTIVIKSPGSTCLRTERITVRVILIGIGTIW